MDIGVLQTNLERLMKARGFNMKSLSLAAKLNETAVRDILRGKVGSPTYKTLLKLSNTLNCAVEELVGTSKITKSPLEEALLSRSRHIDLGLFARTIGTVDKLLKQKKLKPTDLVKAKIYLAWYDLLLINQNDATSDTDNKFAEILNIASRK